MNDVFSNLISLAESLDKENLISIANDVDKVSSSLLDIKTAQYVGVQGYWIRNTRCWQNCYRQKRAQNKSMGAQEAWTNCHEEYMKSINNDGSSWDKYANEASNIKTASKSDKDIYRKANIKFAQSVSEKSKTSSMHQAVYQTFKEAMSNPTIVLLENANKLADIALNLQNSGRKDLSRMASACAEAIIKESQFDHGSNWNPLNWGKKLRDGIGGMTGRSSAKSVTQRLQGVLNSIQNVRTRFPQDDMKGYDPRYQARIRKEFTKLKTDIKAEMSKLDRMTRSNPESGAIFQQILPAFNQFSKLSGLSASNLSSVTQALDGLYNTIATSIGQSEKENIGNANPAGLPGIKQPTAPTANQPAQTTPATQTAPAKPELNHTMPGYDAKAAEKSRASALAKLKNPEHTSPVVVDPDLGKTTSQETEIKSTPTLTYVKANPGPSLKAIMSNPAAKAILDRFIPKEWKKRASVYLQTKTAAISASSLMSKGKEEEFVTDFLRSHGRDLYKLYKSDPEIAKMIDTHYIVPAPSKNDPAVTAPVAPKTSPVTAPAVPETPATPPTAPASTVAPKIDPVAAPATSPAATTAPVPPTTAPKTNPVAAPAATTAPAANPNQATMRPPVVPKTDPVTAPAASPSGAVNDLDSITKTLSPEDKSALEKNIVPKAKAKSKTTVPQPASLPPGAPEMMDYVAPTNTAPKPTAKPTVPPSAQQPKNEWGGPAGTGLVHSMPVSNPAAAVPPVVDNVGDDLAKSPEEQARLEAENAQAQAEQAARAAKYTPQPAPVVPSATPAATATPRVVPTIPGKAKPRNRPIAASSNRQDRKIVNGLIANIIRNF